MKYLVYIFIEYTLYKYNKVKGYACSLESQVQPVGLEKIVLNFIAKLLRKFKKGKDTWGQAEIKRTLSDKSCHSVGE